MAEGIHVYGFGAAEVAFVERPPLPRAEFRLPPDIEIRHLELGDDFFEITMRLPLPSSKPDGTDAQA